MIERNINFEESNLSLAWARAFLTLMKPGVSKMNSLIVTITGFQDGIPEEIPTIRNSLDTFLVQNEEYPVHTTANTIFPQSQWNPNKGRNHLYERYLHIAPRLKRFDSSNKYGLYFRRLISFGAERSPSGKGFNQLEHIISTYTKGNHRPSALQASILDPFVDHTDQRQRGFPCLQQVAFVPDPDTQSLCVIGFYPTQYIIDRAYGNYLGLSRLGHFVAHELGLELTRITCMVGVAERGSCSKNDLLPLVLEVEKAI